MRHAIFSASPVDSFPVQEIKGMVHRLNIKFIPDFKHNSFGFMF